MEEERGRWEGDGKEEVDRYWLFLVRRSKDWTRGGQEGGLKSFCYPSRRIEKLEGKAGAH